MSQPEPRQKPRIAVPLLNFPDSLDVIDILTCTDKVGPQQGECGHFSFKAGPGKGGPMPVFWGHMRGGDHAYGLHTASASLLTIMR